MKPLIQIFANATGLARAVACDIKRAIGQNIQEGKLFHIALSGGTTPGILFEQLAQPPFRQEIAWNQVHIYWSDERCVPIEHPDSNYGLAKASFLDHIDIPPANVHRIHGEADPVAEVERYARELSDHIPSCFTPLPRFDWIMLGLGADGHTASLFPDVVIPGQQDGRLCHLAEHPISRQKRITLSLPVINNAARITFLVTGDEKATIIKDILLRSADNQHYPAARVHALWGVLIWYLDQAAAREIRTV